ncbi:glycosyltransferase [Flavobacteriaceae bacterium M23B6Z8]
MNYYVVIPAHNEAGFLERTLDSLSKQSLLPKKVVVVNDNSSDSTELIIEQYASRHDYIFKHNTTSTDTHLPGSKVINAFNQGLSLLDENYDFIVKLDADLILPANYFAEIAKAFERDSRIGIAGGFAYELENDQWKLNHPMNKDHVRGAFKAYRKNCFQKIGGLKTSMGWDTVDELLARYHQFEIHTDPSLKVKHLRPTGKSYHKKARYLQGEAMYKMRYGFLLCLLASLKMSLKQKKLHILWDNAIGFLKSWISGKPYMVSKDEGLFIRKYRRDGILKKLASR